jgi:uncharacterized protein YecE (DUF72 family)
MGWSYDFWKGNFYLESLTAKEFLGYYARQFGTVEVDSTFYRINCNGQGIFCQCLSAAMYA